jgi:hypothetical protein
MNSWGESGPYDDVIELGGIVDTVRSINFDILNEGRVKRWYTLEIKLGEQKSRCVDRFDLARRKELADRLDRFKASTPDVDFSYLFREYRDFHQI